MNEVGGRVKSFSFYTGQVLITKVDTRPRVEDPRDEIIKGER